MAGRHSAPGPLGATWGGVRATLSGAASGVRLRARAAAVTRPGAKPSPSCAGPRLPAGRRALAGDRGARGEALGQLPGAPRPRPGRTPMAPPSWGRVLPQGPFPPPGFTQEPPPLTSGPALSQGLLPGLTSNLLMNSAKMPKKASEVVALESSPKKASALPSSSMASRCSPSSARSNGWAVSRKD